MKIILPDGSVQEAEDELRAIRHTASHVLAQAVKRLYPETKLAIGPAIDDGFYYDFDREGGFTPEDLEKLEAEMKKIVKENIALKPFTLPRDEAIKLDVYKRQHCKVIKEIVLSNAGHLFWNRMEEYETHIMSL